MKVQFAEVKQIQTKTGKPMFIVNDGNNTYSGFDPRLKDNEGKLVDVIVKEVQKNGKTYNNIEIKEPEQPEQPKLEEAKNGNNQVPRIVWEKKDNRMVRMHAQKVAGGLVQQWMAKQTKKNGYKAVEMVKVIAHELEKDIYRD